MFFTLVNVCYLTLAHLRYSIVYGLPTLLTFGISILYFQKQEQVNWWYMSACIVLLLVLNTLFIYATCRQMLRPPRGEINFLNAIIWRRQHSDFFVFIGLGMIVFVTLSIYALDVAAYLYEKATALGIEQATAAANGSSANHSIYKTLEIGSRLLSYLLLFITLIVWSYICRWGIRIPAYVEGFYLRSEEALDLMRGSLLTILSISLFIIVGVIGIVHVVSTEALATGQEWLMLLLWPLSYFFAITMHIALWVHLYQMLVKASGYHMTRLRL
ncbi:MAG: hypothetical protein K0U15_06150 [Proteobacteria bacterium]|nr:hypothetical protein [Pseudomonadota bacterium]